MAESSIKANKHIKLKVFVEEQLTWIMHDIFNEVGKLEISLTLFGKTFHLIATKWRCGEDIGNYSRCCSII